MAGRIYFQPASSGFGVLGLESDLDPHNLAQ